MVPCRMRESAAFGFCVVFGAIGCDWLRLVAAGEHIRVAGSTEEVFLILILGGSSWGG